MITTREPPKAGPGATRLVRMREPTEDERTAFRTWMLLNARRLEKRYLAAVKLTKLYELTGFYQGHRLTLQTETLTSAVHAAELEWERLR